MNKETQGVQVHGSLKVTTQFNRKVKEVYGMHAFIGWDQEYKSWDIMLQLYKILIGRTWGILCNLVNKLQEGCTATGENVEKIHQHIGWIGGLQL